MRSTRMKSLVLGLACSCAVPALAQEAPPARDEAADDAVPIIVTGTRIQSGYDQPTPVVSSSAETLEASQPAGIAAALNQLPQFQGSLSPRNAPLTSATNNLAARGNFLNLRGVGINRTLILMDGERVPPTSANGQVDVNIIPEMLVSRVDLVTGGVSAVYGSDAVTGVVNYILDNDLTGLRAKAQAGLSGYGDAFSYKFGLAGGLKFAGGRGHVMGSIEHEKSDEILHRDRPLSALQILAVGRGATSNANIAGQAAFPYYFAQGVVSSNIMPGGFFVNGPGAGMQADASGQLVPIRLGTYVGPSSYVGGDGGVISQNRTLISGGRSTRAFGRVSYEVADDIDVFAEGIYARNKTPYHTAINFFQLLAYPQNAFLPTALKPTAAFLAGNPATANTPLGVYLRVPSDLAEPTQLETSRSWSVKTGVRGEISDWKFNAVYIHGEVRQRVTSREVDNRRLFAAADSAIDPVSGKAVCRINLTNPGIFPGCVPYNFFGFGANDANRAALEEFIVGTSRFEVTNKTDDFVFNLSGQPFETWAGPVSVSFGLEYRKNSLVRTSNSSPAVPLDTTGIRGLTTLGISTAYNVTNIGVARGSNSVKEANIEILVPLADKDSAIGEVAVSGAGRWTDYSTSGTVYTWKAGGTWEPVEDLRFRVTRSRDIRAPTLFDLFAGGTSLRRPLLDVHTNFSNPTGTFITGGGNVNLDPEKADTFTAGVILKPRFIPRFALSVDYYDLKIRDAITTLSAEQIVQDCENTGGTGPACSAIVRPLPFSDRTPANYPTSIFAGPINAAQLRTKGVDVEASYSVPLGQGTLGLRALANRLIHYSSQNSSAAPVVSQAGYFDFTLDTGAIQPKWRGSVSATYTGDGGLGALLQARYVGKLRMGEVPGLSVTKGQTSVFEDKAIGAVWYFDVNLSQTIANGPLGGELELFANVNNLFDKKPPIIAIPANVGNLYPTHMPLYDVMGRYFTVGAKVRF